MINDGSLHEHSWNLFYKNTFHFYSYPEPTFQFDSGTDPTFHFYSYPQPTFHFDSDPEPTFYFDSYPEPTFHFDSYPEPTFHFDSYQEPTFHLIRVQIRIKIIYILNGKFCLTFLIFYMAKKLCLSAVCIFNKGHV